MQPPPQARHVLYVERDPTVHVRTASRLRASYPFIQSASDVEEAQRLAGSWALWCGFVVSVDLPDGDGLELAERLRSRFGSIPTLLLTDDPGTRQIGAEDRLRRVDRPLSARDLDTFLIQMARLGHGSESAMVAVLADDLCLTARESEILHAALVGDSTYGQIATELGVTPSTVQAHVSMISIRSGGITMRKLRRRWQRWLRSPRPMPPFGVSLLTQ